MLLARFKIMIFSFTVAGIMSMLLLHPASHAEELKAGTVITAENLKHIGNDTFEGKTIQQMLPEKIQQMISEYGLTVTLRHSEKIPVDGRWIEATRKYAGGVSFDPETRTVSGYQAGLAFPDVSADDPHAAEKVIWNMYLSGGWPKDDFQYVPSFATILIDGKRGIERTMKWSYMRVWMTGRIGGPPVLDDGSVYYKQVLCGYHPYDIQGVGNFLIRYNDGRMDDIWAYTRASRRTRRLLGGSWMDPIGSTDQLNDEIAVFSAYPTWYPGYSLKGRQTILAVAHSRGRSWDETSAGNPYPNLDTENPPYWNPVNEWEPREVWVIEATMPKKHPYKRRIYYVDTQAWIPYLCECYGKNDRCEKIILNDYKPFKGDDGPGSWGMIPVSGYFIDMNKNHATVFMQSENTHRNPPAMNPGQVTMGTLKAIAQGQWKPPL